jgi:hypothetical protein
VLAAAKTPFFRYRSAITAAGDVIYDNCGATATTK